VVSVEDGTSFDRQGLSRRLLREGFDHVAGRVTILLSAGDPLLQEADRDDGFARCDGGVGGLARAVASAVECRRHLLVISDDAVPGLDCVGRLIETFRLDPMIGFASPRFSTRSGEQLWPLPKDAEWPGPAAYPRTLLPFLPEVYLCTEVLSAVLLIRRQPLTALRADPGWGSVDAALLSLLIQGRRLGYRTAIVNRAVTPARSPRRAYTDLDAPTLERISGAYACHPIARSWFAAETAHRRESVLAAALEAGPGRPRRLLLDIRGLGERHNGSSVAILGILDGLQALAGDWRIDLLVASGADRWHRLSERYPRFGLVLDRPHQRYTVAIRLCQPWSLRTLVELHAHALAVAVTFLDTIMWDIIYPCSPSLAAELTATWEFSATYLDGLLFISDYSRQRFNFRFPMAARTRQLVSGLSFHTGDYVDSTEAAPAEGHTDILVFGNDYDHKWVAGALEWIADAFPFASILAFGATESPRPHVRAVPSGQLSVEEMRRLFAGVKVLCFPSFYEGFGLPILEGLAHGRDVVARRSGLLDEVAAQYRGPGRLVPFDDPLSLVEAIGRLLAGHDVETLTLGTGIPEGQAPMSWRGVAGRIFEMADEMTTDVDPRLHDAREAALRMLWLNGSPNA
jgi:glycosyltransferase involved in cell wall biosynthesis